MKTVTFTSPVEYGDEIWVNDIIVENGKVTAIESHPTRVICVTFFAEKNSPFIYTHSGRYLAEDVFMDKEEAKKMRLFYFKRLICQTSLKYIRTANLPL